MDSELQYVHRMCTLTSERLMLKLKTHQLQSNFSIEILTNLEHQTLVSWLLINLWIYSCSLFTITVTKKLLTVDALIKTNASNWIKL